MDKENDLGEILAQEMERVKECGERINLAEIGRRTGISRAVLRRWQSNGYVLQPSRKGWRSGTSKLEGVSETVDALLGKGVTNSTVILERIRKLGYDGGISILSCPAGEPGPQIHHWARGLLPDGLGLRRCGRRCRQ